AGDADLQRVPVAGVDVVADGGERVVERLALHDTGLADLLHGAERELESGHRILLQWREQPAAGRVRRQRRSRDPYAWAVPGVSCSFVHRSGEEGAEAREWRD